MSSSVRALVQQRLDYLKSGRARMKGNESYTVNDWIEDALERRTLAISDLIAGEGYAAEIAEEIGDLETWLEESA